MKDKMSGTTEGEKTSTAVASEPALSSVDKVVDKKHNVHYMEVVWISKK